jgi:hypothetical protein
MGEALAESCFGGVPTNAATLPLPLATAVTGHFG